MIQELSLSDLIQEIQRRIQTDPLSLDQHSPLLHLASTLLVTCGKTTTQSYVGRDMQEIREQPLAKRVLEIAAAGGHPMLLVGPPGVGKRMLVHALPTILPQTEVPCPFRAPHFS